jgi:SAM-dependent methyltransferase
MSDQAGEALRRPWTIGDYPVVARHLLPISVQLVEAVGIRAGDRVLDVGVGTGNTAIEAARLGARVTGIDLTPAQIDRARARCVDEGVDVDLQVGDVQNLDLPAASFDVVLSVMGMIFAPDHARALSEMVRVCRPGGIVIITTWREGGWTSRWRKQAAQLLPAPPPGGPAPEGWGDADEVLGRFAHVGLHATIAERPFAWEFDSLEAALDVFVRASGPFVQIMETASALGRGDEVLGALRSALEECNQARDGTCVLPAPFLLARASPSLPA